MSQEKISGRMIFIWSGQPTEEYQEWVPMAELRKNLVACDRCGKTIDCACVGHVPEENLQEMLDYIRDYVAKQECGKHHLPQPGPLSLGS